jgi:hypothetical protein
VSVPVEPGTWGDDVLVDPDDRAERHVLGVIVRSGREARPGLDAVGVHDVAVGRAPDPHVSH